MDVIEAIKQRKSERKYLSKQIPQEILLDIVDCARLAPTAYNIQPWKFVLVTNQETKEKMAKFSSWGKFLTQSNAAIVVFGATSKYMVEDCSAATENILLAATGHGIASCWISGYDRPYSKDIAQILGAPEGWELVSIISLGYSDDRSVRARKKSLDQVLSFEKFEDEGDVQKALTSHREDA